MRARWLKPEFFRDKKIGQLGMAAALVYEALWCMSDDGGVAEGAAEEIKGEMFTWWDELTVEAIRAALSRLEEAGRITGYVVGDHQYWELHHLLKHQGKIHKPSKHRYPRHSKHSVNTLAPVTEDSEKVHHLDTHIPQHLDTSTPNAEADVGGLRLSGLLITRLNQGMLDNPEIGEAMNPVPHGHAASLSAALNIEKAGVSEEFASSFVYDAAKKYKPSERNRQIKSLGYLENAVISAWERRGALTAASRTSRPQSIPEARRTVRGKTLAATKLIAHIRNKRNPLFPGSVSADWYDGLSDIDREVAKTFGLLRILNDQNEGTLVSQLARALEEAEEHSPGEAA